MMELHEENKLMREALEQIARYQADGPFHARRTLAAIGPAASAAQPEGEAAPSVDIPFELRELLSQHADERNQGMAGPAMNAIYAWHQSKLAEADRAQASVRTAYAKAAERCEQRAEKAEAERDEARALANSRERRIEHLIPERDIAEAAQPAPQAGDALGSIDTDRYQELMSNYMELRDSYNGHQHEPHQKARAVLIGHIDASRREAYDKGRAEVMEAGRQSVREAAEAKRAALNLANDWAATAINGLQWLRNLKQGMPVLDEALANMEQCVADMHKRWPEYDAAHAAPPASAAQQVPK